MHYLFGEHRLSRQSLTQRLVRFQNRAVRLLYNLQRMDHVTEYYRYAEWLPLPQLVMYRSLCLMFYQYHCDYGRGIPLEPSIQFGNLSGYNTRTESTFAHSVRCHFSFSQHSFRFKVVKSWNSLPTAIRDHLHFSDFKDDLKTYFISDL